MIFPILLCLAVAASALPTPESQRKVFFMGPNGVKTDKNVVGFTMTPQSTGLKTENGFFIPTAQQLQPLYLFTVEKSKQKSPEGSKDGNKKDNEEDAKQQFQLVRIDIFTEILEPAASFLFNTLSGLFSILLSSDDEEEENRSYYMVMTK